MKHGLLFFIALIALPLGLMSQVTGDADALITHYLEETGGATLKSAKLQYDVMADQAELRSGIRRIQANQKANGIYVKDAILSIAHKKEGKMLGNNTFTGYKPNTTKPTVSAIEALQVSMAKNQVDGIARFAAKETKKSKDAHVIYARDGQFASDPETRLIYVKDDASKSLRLAWETQLHTIDRQHYWVSYIDAQTGDVISTEDKVLHCSFGASMVYDASPEEQAILDAREHERHMQSAAEWEQMHAGHHHNYSAVGEPVTTTTVAPAHSYLVLDLPAEAPNDDSAHNGQTVVKTAGDPVASPYGWTSTDGILQLPFTKGNNVYAFYDPSPTPLGGAPNPATAAQASSNNLLGEQQFYYEWDLTKEPEYMTTSTNNTFPNRNAAIVNLFYQNNLVHDVFYNFGFDEAGRNFQFENFGKGGLGLDEVLAQAQDGGGTNNANMLTLQDGVSPQMQMYLWTASEADELVQITSVSTPTFAEGGDKFLAIQGAIYSTLTPYDLHANPVLDKPLVLVNDGCGSSLGCGMGSGIGSAPCNSVTGSIVLIDRGDCSFVEKVDGAQKGGAAGVIVMNNNTSNPDEVAAMGGTDPTANTITIPSVMVSYNTGLILKESLAEGATIIGSLIQENPPSPKKDGDFDNGIIAHEYGHGISSRTSPQGLLGGTLSGSEQGGEGWSDYYALYLTTTASDLAMGDPLHPNGVLPSKGIGTYVTHTDSDGPGIRPRKYSIDMTENEYTFAGTTNGGIGIGNSAEITVPHGVGFIWCTMLWEMTQNLVDEYGFNDDVTYNPPTGDISAIAANHAGNNLALKLVQEGIRLQVPSPSFTDMRDAILMADTLHYDGAHGCLIWQAFAKRGLGVDAINPSNNIGDERDGYATPCDQTQAFHDIKVSAPSVLENESDLTHVITVTNTSPAASSDVPVTYSLPDYFTLTGVTGADYMQVGQTLIFSIDEIAAESAHEISVTGYILTETAAEITASYGFESGTEGWTAVTGVGNSFERRTDGDAQEGSAYFYTTNNGLTGLNTTLESPTLPASDGTRQLRFWHKYDTDAGYDGGYVEYTTDGTNWALLPLQENGYNANLGSLYNVVYTGPAFSGGTADYIESAGMLPAGTTNVRFVFTEDAGTGGGDGWFIDNIKIVENPAVTGTAVTVKDPINSGGRTYVDEVHTLIIPSTKPTFDIKPSISVATGVVNDDGTPMRVLVDMIEMSGNQTTGPVKVRIAKNDFLGFDFDPSLTSIGGHEVDNDLFTFSENFLYWEFTTSANILANESLKIGFTGTFESGGDGILSITAKTATLSKLEDNKANDKDQDTVDYTTGE